MDESSIEGYARVTNSLLALIGEFLSLKFLRTTTSVPSHRSIRFDHEITRA